MNKKRRRKEKKYETDKNFINRAVSKWKFMVKEKHYLKS